MKKTFKINKLVRDHFIDIMEKQNISVNFHVLSQKDYEIELKKKLIEEATEVSEEENKDNIIIEMADVLEVLYGLCDYYGISMENVEEKRKDKKEKRGSFNQKIYSTTLTVHCDNPHIEYFLNKPTIYPEI